MSKQMTREQYMDEIGKIGNETGQWELIEEIVDRHGASPDGSDPNEGYFVTMSDLDIRAAYQELVDRLSEDNDPEKRYLMLSARPTRELSVYDQGWIDGFESARGIYCSKRCSL